jgi:hypothetical protein
VLAADSQVARSILLYQSDKDKIKALDSHKLLASAGPQVSNIDRFNSHICICLRACCGGHCATQSVAFGLNDIASTMIASDMASSSQ